MEMKAEGNMGVCRSRKYSDISTCAPLGTNVAYAQLNKEQVGWRIDSTANHHPIVRPAYLPASVGLSFQPAPPRPCPMPHSERVLPLAPGLTEMMTLKRGYNLGATNQNKNSEEFQREKYIESLKLPKDEKYFHLLMPYKHQRIQEDDEIFQKVTYTYVCKYDDCDKVFSKACNFLDHVRMHEGVKPYQCTLCDKEFVQKWNLRKHFKKHEASSLSERKVFKCVKCNKGFTERYNLKVGLYKIRVLRKQTNISCGHVVSANLLHQFILIYPL